MDVDLYNRNSLTKKKIAATRRILIYAPYPLQRKDGLKKSIEMLVKALMTNKDRLIYILSESSKVETFEFLNSLHIKYPRAFLSYQIFPANATPNLYGFLTNRHRRSGQAMRRSWFTIFVTFMIECTMLMIRTSLVKLTIRRIPSSILLLSITNIYDLAILNFISTPAIAWVHVPFPFRGYLPFLFRLVSGLRPTRRGGNHLICTNSDLMARKAKSIFPNHIVKPLYPPYDEVYNYPGSLKRENLVLMVGRIDRDKNFELGIEAIHSIVRGHSFPLRLIIIGELRNRQYFRYLLQRIEELEIEKYVSILLNGDPETIKQLYSRAAVFWNFGVGYYGITNVEAMACGCIPLVTPNYRDVVPYKELVCYSVQAFVKKTIKLLKTPNLEEFRESVASYARSRFSSKEFCAKVVELLELSTKTFN